MLHPCETDAPAKSSRVNQPTRFWLARGIAVGVGLTGVLVVAMSITVPMPPGLVSRTETLGGLFLMFSGLLLLFAFGMLRLRTDVSAFPGYGFASVLLLAGAAVAVKGYSADLARQRRFNDMKANLKLLGEALERTRRNSAEEKNAAETESR